MTPPRTLALIEPLETRSHLSFTPIGPETIFPLRLLGAEFAVAGDGSFLAVGMTQDPDGVNLRALRFSAAGEQVGEPLLLATSHPSAGFFSDVSASMDADGDAVIVYGVTPLGVDSTVIRAVRISRSGAVGDAMTVRDGAKGYGPGPDVAVSMDAGGGFFVGWTEESDVLTDPDGSFSVHRTVQVRAFDADDAPRGAQFVASPEDGFSHAHDLDIAAAPDGSGAAFAYREDVGSSIGGATRKYVRQGRVSAAAPLGEPQRVGASDLSDNPDVAVAADGSYVVGYEFRDHAGYHGLVHRFDSDGNQLGAAINIGGTGLGLTSVNAVKVAALADGDFSVGFGAAVNGGAHQMFIQRFFASGAPEDDAPFALTPPLGNGGVSDFALRADHNGNALVLYKENNTSNRQSDRHHVRRLADFAINDRGDLYVLGTDGADAIDVRLDGAGRVVATRGGRTATFDAALVDVLSVNGFGGNDRMASDLPVPSTLHGGDGNDSILSGGARDRVTGGAGYDRLDGGPGHDSIDGGDGRDWIRGQGGNDTLHGGAWGDFLNGGPGHDRLLGGGFPDLLDGGTGSDTIDGGAGNDRFLSSDGEIDHLFGDAGIDAADEDEDDVLSSVEV